MIGDAFGAALLDALGGGRGTHTIERDDGFTEPTDAAGYFAPPEDWPVIDRAPLDLVSGRILDVGAGAGRHSLAFERLGHQVVALDTSPGAVEVCRRRGIVEVFEGTVEDLAAASPEPFDAAIMMGHNLVLLAIEGALEAMRTLLRPGGIVVGTNLDPYRTDDPIHLAYHRRNRAKGRVPGNVRLRVRRGTLATPWFDWCFMAPTELTAHLEVAGWRVADLSEPSPSYLAVVRPA